MAILSIKLKAIADKECKARIRSAHDIFNENVRIFEEFMLLARGKDYYYTDKDGIEQYQSEEETQNKLREYLKNRNINNIEACITALSGLDRVISDKGSQAAGMLAKLYNAESTAGTNNIAKIVDPEPLWVSHYNLAGKCFDREEYKDEADKWIMSEEGQNSIRPSLAGSGRPSSFKQAYTSGKEWYAQFISDQGKYKKDLKDGLSNILYKLEKENAFPLIDIEGQLIENHPVWVKLMLKTALENYASFLASDNTTRDNYNKTCEEYNKIEEIVTQDYLKQYEKVNEFLLQNYQQTDRTVGLTQRMLRGIDELRIKWKKCDSADERITVINEIQADSVKQRKIGDVNLLRWLAEDDNYPLCFGDCLDIILKYYQAIRNKEMKRKCAAYTVADPINSKRYLFYESESGTNYRRYSIKFEEKKMYVTVSLLLKDSEGNYYEQDETFMLAPSAQMQNIQKLDNGELIFENDKKVCEKGYYAQVRESFVGRMGGADLRVETNGIGATESIFMSFTITVKEKYTEDFKTISDAALYSFRKAYDAKPDKINDSKLANRKIRALSIDMGLKQFGACAVGEVNYGENLIELPNINFERMFLIKLPGEKTDSLTEQRRNEAMLELRQIRSEIRYISQIKRIYNQDDFGRKKMLEKCFEFYKQPEKKGIFKYCLDCGDNNEISNCLVDEYSRMMRIMNERMKAFRAGRVTARQERSYKPGKSFWSIAYLEELRKIILAWNSLSFTIDADNVVMNKEYGVTATRLLKHIQNLKDDRIKIGADAIIQSALGYVYDDGCNCWVKTFDPCNVIVFEDLSRYRFSLDRPARENSKLMKWAHREIINKTTHQASIYGIAVYDRTDAAYSSKFCYRNGTPGIRCDRLSKNDFDANGMVKANILDRLPERLKNLKYKVGDLIPSEIGSIFATVKEDGELYLINADMNAACNLLNRFYGKHTHLLSLKTRNDKGYLKLMGENDEDEVSDNIGKRVRGKYLYNYGTDKLMLVSAEIPGKFNLVKKEKGMTAPEIGNEKTYNLFHDPSGIIYPKEQWIGYRTFWSGVEDTIIEKIAELI